MSGRSSPNIKRESVDNDDNMADIPAHSPQPEGASEGVVLDRLSLHPRDINFSNDPYASWRELIGNHLFEVKQDFDIFHQATATFAIGEPGLPVQVQREDSAETESDSPDDVEMEDDASDVEDEDPEIKSEDAVEQTWDDYEYTVTLSIDEQELARQHGQHDRYASMLMTRIPDLHISLYRGQWTLEDEDQPPTRLERGSTLDLASEPLEDRSKPCKVWSLGRCKGTLWSRDEPLVNELDIEVDVDVVVTKVDQNRV